MKRQTVRYKIIIGRVILFALGSKSCSAIDYALNCKKCTSGQQTETVCGQHDIDDAGSHGWKCK